jgi:hypothetical protein
MMLQLRVLRGQAPFMQKNVPKYTPDWVPTVPVWAEASKREVSYALCNDRRTLLWFANQRAGGVPPDTVPNRRTRSSNPPGNGYLIRRMRMRSSSLSQLPGWCSRHSQIRGWRVRSRPAARRVCTSSYRLPPPRPKKWPRRPGPLPRAPSASIPRPPPPRSFARTARARCSSTRCGLASLAAASGLTITVCHLPPVGGVDVAVACHDVVAHGGERAGRGEVAGAAPTAKASKSRHTETPAPTHSESR